MRFDKRNAAEKYRGQKTKSSPLLPGSLTIVHRRIGFRGIGTLPYVLDEGMKRHKFAVYRPAPSRRHAKY